MPWVALDFETGSDLKDALSTKFDVSGIPSLVLVDAAGATVTKNARDGVAGDPAGFPWTPVFAGSATPLDVLSSFPALLKAAGDVAPAQLAGKHLMLYFSAHWCPPCRKFTPKLAAAYEALRARGVDVEVVFISSDKSAAEFGEYFGEMPWAAAPFEHAKFKAAKGFLSEKYDIEGIPSLLLFGPDGALLEADCVSKVASDAECARFPWPRRPVESVEDTMGKINSGPVVVAFCGDDGDAAAATALLEAAATSFYGKAGAPLFAVGKGGSRGEGAIAGFCNFQVPDGAGVKFVIVDVQARKKAFIGGVDATATPSPAEVEAWVAAYVAGSAPSVGIKE
jgi:nucleoredoxin